MSRPGHSIPTVADRVQDPLHRYQACKAMARGYRVKDLVEQFEVKPAEIRALFSNTLDPQRAAELRDKMRGAGLPI